MPFLFSGICPLKIEVISEYKWWSINELKQTTDVVFPLSLKIHIDSALTNPNYPIDISDSDELLSVSFGKKQEKNSLMSSIVVEESETKHHIGHL